MAPATINYPGFYSWWIAYWSERVNVDCMYFNVDYMVFNVYMIFNVDYMILNVITWYLMLFCITVLFHILLFPLLLQHSEFGFLLTEKVCPLVIKLSSPQPQVPPLTEHGQRPPPPPPPRNPAFPSSCDFSESSQSSYDTTTLSSYVEYACVITHYSTEVEQFHLSYFVSHSDVLYYLR